MIKFSKVKKRIYFITIALPLAAIILFLCIFGFTTKVKAADLMSGVKTKAITQRNPDDRFKKDMNDFSLTLLKAVSSEDENILISPLSISLALSMTANGANKDTLSQMNTVLSKNIPLTELNEYFASYITALPSTKESKVKLANSIWYRDASWLHIDKNFLQTNASYYKANAYQAPFNDQTKKDINNWVKTHTNGMIDKILDSIDKDEIMYLINSVMFDARWETIYKKHDIGDISFNNQNGSTTSVKGMNSIEAYYYHDNQAAGVMKSYSEDKYRFVAILPNEDISLKDYLSDLDGDKLYQIFRNFKITPVDTTIPKFKYDYSIVMNDALQELGIIDAFSPDKADFTKMGGSDQGNLYMGEVLHKTHISVDELGTKAGATTVVSINTTTAAPGGKNTIILNRPFLYAIVDSSTMLPIFIGTVTNLNK